MSDVLPNFSSIDINTFKDRLDEMLSLHIKNIDNLLCNVDTPTFENIMHPLDLMSDELERFWSPFSHLHSVMNSKELRACYQSCLPILSAYESEIGQNERLYKAINGIDKDNLNDVQKKIISDVLLDFRLSGVALAESDKTRYQEITAELSELASKYENNVLDAVQDFKLHITDENMLKGVPPHILEASHLRASQEKLDGWLLNLEQPTFVGIMTHAENRDLRETFYTAYTTRASDKGPSANKFDNTEVMNKLLANRHELANLLGYKNYAEKSLAKKMANSTKDVNDFLNNLVVASRKRGLEEFSLLKKFAQENHGITDVKPWDIAFLSEKKQQFEFSISEEELRPYFPLSNVLQGLFTIANRLYGIKFQRVDGVDVWHQDVACYVITDEDNLVRGYIYLDLFARANKRGGAWMDSCQSRFRIDADTVQVPIATLTCNFAQASGGKPDILSHDEVQTLFHEFGHCLHHVLTKVDYISVSGVHGVEWDAVELPSQFFENWCWDEQSIALLSKHVDTGESIPLTMFKQMIAAKNFQSAMAMLRQLEFAIFDFEIHEGYDANDANFIAKTIARVRDEVSVVPIAPFNRFENSFSHIFAGGYAAGYYSYKWAEVLSCDAFARFEEDGVFNKNTGREFLHKILEVGGSKHAKDAFIDFRGREARVDALLKYSGI